MKRLLMLIVFALFVAACSNAKTDCGCDAPGTPDASSADAGETVNPAATKALHDKLHGGAKK